LVGASDKVKEAAFEWCFSDLPANVSPNLKWKTGQPDNLNNAEHCVNMIASSGTVPNNILLSDLSCDTTKMKYLCEVEARAKRISQVEINKIIFSLETLTSVQLLSARSCHVLLMYE
jgi:hypothetical protein